MFEWKLPWTAACRCEKIRMRVTAPPIVTMACHCAGCQRMSASAFSLSIFLPSSGFEVTQGEPVIGGMHGESRHYHCEWCKSWLYSQAPQMGPYVNMRATMLDDHSWYAPFVETCTSEALPWARTGAKHSFPNLAPPEAYTPIVAEFAASGPRPT